MAERRQTDEKDTETDSFVRRKKFRKGTQSCIECRRRKIRCIYPSDGSNTCSPCSARGSRCKSQNEKTILNPEIETMTLRERVARLESVLDKVLKMLPNGIIQDDSYVVPTQNTSDTEDITTTGHDLDSRAPFVSILDDAELLSPDIPDKSQSFNIRNEQSYATPSASSVTTSTSYVAKHSNNVHLKRYEQKSKQICEKLRSSLPPYDQLQSTLDLSGSWWCHFHRKTHPFAKAKESLVGYAAQLYTSDDPVDLGILVIAFARSTTQDNQLYSLVEQLVISDKAYAYSIHGLECLLLLAKVYTDIGQPRRSWCLTRSGLNAAQLMGLYQQSRQDPRCAIVWHSLYHMDRFASLLLGLPYGVNDAHFPHLVVSDTGDADFVPHLFTHKCAFIASKILDRNLTGNKSSYAATIDLEDELSTIAAAMSPEWWDVPTTLCGDEAEIDHLRTRLQQHVYFFQLRTYLHLPFLINASKSDPYHHSKLACVEGARQMLRRFLVYHAMVNGEKLFECKTADFVGFMAAAILLIGLSKLDSGLRPELSQEDSEIISSIKAIFRESEKKGCRIAAQCQKALMLLSPSDNHNIDNGAEPIKIPIPYFGVVVHRRVKDTGSSSLSSQHSSTTLSTQGKNTTSGDLDTNALTVTQAFSDPLSLTYSMLDNMSWEVDEFGNLPILDTTQWFNTETMEIDQDWTMFLNDNIS